MDSEKRKELWRAIKFTLFSLSAGIIEIVSFTERRCVIYKNRIVFILHLFTNRIEPHQKVS